ncbi:MAG: hypothetical protein PHS54_03320 [Clostridia bacterium]|nr:hypothetical protein [Clostridia bacterium]
MKKIFLLILKILSILLIFLILTATYHVLFVNEEYWTGFYYPNGNKVGSTIYSPHFNSKEECVGWAINERGLRPEDKDINLGSLWECQKNCVLEGTYATSIHSNQDMKQHMLDQNIGPQYYCLDGGFDGDDWLRGDF